MKKYPIFEAMGTLLDKIKELQEISTLSKHEQLVDGIRNAIDEGILKVGDQLPSVNQMVDKVGFARKTIVKAYDELKSRGIVESKNFVGYFIASEKTSNTLKVALLLYAFHPFQETFYNTFRALLGKETIIDVFFHHNNPEIYDTILSSINRKYGYYVIAPIPGHLNQHLKEKIASRKVLFVDRLADLSGDYSYICQEFYQATTNVLQELKSDIDRFESAVLFFKEGSDYPIGILEAFKKFCQESEIPFEVVDTYSKKHLRKSTAYLIINDTELVELLIDCNKSKLNVGKDVGILSHNETAFKELIGDGITTFSTDFKLMAKEAADLVLTRSNKTQIIPTKLIRRNSL